MSEKIDRYDNWTVEIAEGVLSIYINVDESEVDVQPSQSGKTLVIATTGGAKRVPNSPLRLNLTVYRKP
jgi:hypothetical protein